VHLIARAAHFRVDTTHLVVQVTVEERRKRGARLVTPILCFPGRLLDFVRLRCFPSHLREVVGLRSGVTLVRIGGQRGEQSLGLLHRQPALPYHREDQPLFFRHNPLLVPRSSSHYQTDRWPELFNGMPSLFSVYFSVLSVSPW